jgi:hypothetical protein
VLLPEARLLTQSSSAYCLNQQPKFSQCNLTLRPVTRITLAVAVLTSFIKAGGPHAATPTLLPLPALATISSMRFPTAGLPVMVVRVSDEFHGLGSGCALSISISC